MKRFYNNTISPKIIEKSVYKRRNIIDKRKRKGYLRNSGNRNSKILLKAPIPAPRNFSFLTNQDQCLLFFNQIRMKDRHSIIRGRYIMRISLSRVEQIDFATISILKSIFEESKYYGIRFSGTMPKNKDCKDFLMDSGFLNSLYDEKMELIQIPSNGKHFSFKKKAGKLTDSDVESFEKLSDEVYQHLTGKVGYCDELITLLKEIGGNAIEWSDSYNNQWQIGVYFLVDKVVFNVVDLGKGILESLYVSDKLKLIDYFLFRDSLDTLERAFERKYGSVSQEINRNRGLPSIKRIFKDKKISNLLVASNNVFLDFENSGKSINFKGDTLVFMGSFYQWEISKSCIF